MRKNYSHQVPGSANLQDLQMPFIEDQGDFMIRVSQQSPTNYSYQICVPCDSQEPCSCGNFSCKVENHEIGEIRLEAILELGKFEESLINKSQNP